MHTHLRNLGALPTSRFSNNHHGLIIFYQVQNVVPKLGESKKTL